MKEDRKKLLEQYITRKGGQISITKVVLVSIAVLGFITVMAALPGLPLALAPFVKKKNLSKRQLYEAYRSLERSGYVTTTQLLKGKQKITLTPKGEKRIQTIVIDAIQIPQPVVWDGMWRFVVFDIPGNKKKVRNEFRFKLKDLGLQQYQNSVWVHPYPCDKQIKDVVYFYTLQEYVDVLVVKDLWGSRKLEKEFNLR